MIDTKALREKVLDLAIRGKLVPQDPNDEPASILLERIREQKKQMVKEGKLKAKDIKDDSIIFVSDDNLHYEKFDDGSVKCIEDEIPFELPSGWAWERMSNIARFSGGKTPSTSHREYWDGNILWVTSKDMKSKYINSSLLMISEQGLEQMQLYPERTLLLVTRSGILRHTIPVAILEKPATINQDLKAIMPYISNLEEYIYICIKGMESRLILEYTKAGATVENINFDAFQKILLPIPPEKQIPKLINATNETEKIICCLESNQSDLIGIISNLKLKILDLAIQGKLVPQNPEDEPASVLLERIRAEKEELIKAGKIKRDKKESVIFKGDDNSYYEKIGENIVDISEEVPFEIPENWSFVRLEDVLDYEQPTPYIVKSTDYKDEYQTPVLTAGKSFIIGYTNEADGIKTELPVIIFDDFTTDSKFVDFPFKVKSSAMKILKAEEKLIDIKFAYYAMQIVECDNYNHKRYWISEFSKKLIPLPPKTEQSKIVNAIEELYKYIEQSLS